MLPRWLALPYCSYCLRLAACPIFILIHYISRPMNRSAIDRAAAILFALLSATLIAAFFCRQPFFPLGIRTAS
ncbi:Uncharacterised protein [Helicobacter pametensis]|nr:Uncharacterised protein [Helicobacter pametensis]